MKPNTVKPNTTVWNRFHNRLRCFRDDKGIATLWCVGVITVLMAALALSGYVTCVIITRHRAGAAADLAALAAASYAVSDPDNACTRARWITDHLTNSSLRCLITGNEAFVELSLPLPPWCRIPGTVTMHARAGPSET